MSPSLVNPFSIRSVVFTLSPNENVDAAAAAGWLITARAVEGALLFPLSSISKSNVRF
jgi:hypothetical protein